MKLSPDETTIRKVDSADISSTGHFEIPENITGIDGYVFDRCVALTRLTFPKGFRFTGIHAFRHCTGLTQVSFPEGVNRIGWGAFYGCTNLTEVTFPSTLTSIGLGAFQKCTSLKQVTVSQHITTLEPDAFEGCTSLEHIIINTQVDVEFDRIKALLPQNLQSKAIRKDIYDKVKALRQEALEALCRAPKINPLLGVIPFFRATDEDCKLPMINDADLIFNINEFVGRDSTMYQLAEDAMLKLTLPDELSKCDEYEKQLASIVKQYKSVKKSAVNIEQGDDDDDDDDEDDSPEQSGHHVRYRVL